LLFLVNFIISSNNLIKTNNLLTLINKHVRNI